MITELSDEYMTLVRYFLGELAEEEQEFVEERYMVDEQYSGLRDEVEMDLVDAYVAGTLTAAQRRHFERHYLITTERREAVRAAFLSKTYRERLARPAAAPALSEDRQWHLGSKGFVPALAAAVVMAIIGAGALIMTLRREPKPAPAPPIAEKRQTAPPQPVVQPPAKPAPVLTARNQPPPPQIASSHDTRRASAGGTTLDYSAQGNAIRQQLDAEYGLLPGFGPSPHRFVQVPEKGTLLAAASDLPCRNIYRDGAITPWGGCHIANKSERFRALADGTAVYEDAPTKKLTPNERLWVSGIEVHPSGADRGIVFHFLSDGYRSSLLIPFGETLPTPEEALKMVNQVISVAPPHSAPPIEAAVPDTATPSSASVAMSNRPHGSTTSFTAGVTGNGKEAIRQMLESEYQLTKITGDKSSIVTAGSVVALNVDAVLMVASTSTATPCVNTYKGGKITAGRSCGTGEKAKKFGAFAGHIPGASSPPNVTTRNFVSGEKFWVTKIEVLGDRIVLDFFTNPVNHTRYMASLMIPFGAFMPTPGEALGIVNQVISVVPPGDAPPAEAAAPNPRQPSTPAQITTGQTIEEVTAVLGPPIKPVIFGNKRIYIYKDVKVTFVDGKVTSVE